MEFQFKRSTKSLLLLFLALTLSSISIDAAEQESKYFNELKTKFHSVSSEFYDQAMRRTDLCPLAYSNIQSLDLAIRQHMDKQRHIVAICSIKKSLPLIENAIDSPSSTYFLSILLEHNELNTAKRIYSLTQDYADNLLTANANYLFAQYYFANKNWQQTLLVLKEISDELPFEKGNHALLISGIALQQLKQHRKAIKLYEKIPATSKYYSAAVLNIATANIRQDWWTDAHIVINNLLKDQKISKSDSTVNRLYMVLGYSLLEKGYFRNARDAFRKVSLNSEYTNRALLGIALSATNQEDFVGALNALTILKDTKPMDLSVEESYLLLPYIYEKLNQHMTASASYTEAMNYYQGRVNELSGYFNIEIQNKILNDLSHGKDKFLIKETEFDIPAIYPAYLINNYIELKNFSSNIDRIKSRRLRTKITDLKKAYKNILDSISHKIIEQRKEYLLSYMNQARYGLARLYDNSGFINQE